MYLFFNSQTNYIEAREDYPGYLYCSESVLLLPVESGITCTTEMTFLTLLAGVAREKT